MIKKVLLYLYVRKSNFVQAIVYSKNLEQNNSLIWYYYHLNMYETVKNLELIPPYTIKDLYAKIVSCAAYGSYEESRKFLRLFLETEEIKKEKLNLANALLPYLPQKAFELLDEDSTPLTLYLATLLKLGRLEEAQEFSEKHLMNSLTSKCPEFYLYRSNSLLSYSTSHKIDLLNSFMACFSLGKIKLKDMNKALSTENIELQNSFESSNGPLVSVLMTTFETGNRLNTAISSVLNQTYTNLELYIVDDASNDKTPQIIQEWLEKDSRITYIQLEQNVGTYVAKNIVLLQAKGEFVTCHDSDDWSHPLKIERQVRPLIKNWRLVATISSWVRVSDRGEFYARAVHPLMRQNASSLMFKKDIVLKKAGLWDCVRTGADSEFIARLKIVFGQKRVRRIKEPLSFGSHRSDSLMNAKDTGYCDLGMSSQRLDYWEAWSQWHIDQLSQGKKPFISLNLLESRSFDIPDSIRVSTDKIQLALRILKSKQSINIIHEL